MKPKSAFSEAKARTAKGNARFREKLANEKVEDLLGMGDVDVFVESLLAFGLKRGELRFAQALAAWRESQRRS